MPVTAYSTVPGNNNGAPPNGAPEGCAPSTINDIIRQIMADIAVEAQTGAVSTLNTIAGTDTITADMNPELTAYATGMIIKFTPANNNTGAATINIDGLGAKSIVKGDGTALAAGDLQASTMHFCVYDGTNFVLLNPLSIAPTAAGILAALLTVDGSGSGLDADTVDGINGASLAQVSSGSFTGTLTGYAANPTGTIQWRKSGTMVTLTCNAGITGTSNANTMTMTGLPAAVQALQTYNVWTRVTDNGTASLAVCAVTASDTLTFGLGATGGTFTASGTKGIPGSWSVTYDVG